MPYWLTVDNIDDIAENMDAYNGEDVTRHFEAKMGAGSMKSPNAPIMTSSANTKT